MIKRKTQLSSFDILVLAKELNEQLNGGFIDKIYQQMKDQLTIRITVPKRDLSDKMDAMDESNNSDLVQQQSFDHSGGKYNHFNLMIKSGKFLYLEDRDKIQSEMNLTASEPIDSTDTGSPSRPGSFAMLLRKYLKNGKISRIHQYQFERIVLIDVSKIDPYQLVIELFGEGNVLLLKTGKIIQPLFPRTWSARTLRAGEDYKFPPERLNPRVIANNEFIEILKNSNKDLVRTLIMDLDIPGKFSEELCLRTGLEKNIKPSMLNEEQYLKIYDNLKQMFYEIETTPKSLMIYDIEEISIPFDFVPIELKIFNNYPSKEFENYNSLVYNYFIQTQISPLGIGTELGISSDKLKGYTKTLVDTEQEQERLQRQLQQQKTAMNKFQDEIELNHMIGETIYGSYQRCEELLKTIQELRSRFSTEEVIEQLSKLEDIKEYNPNEGYCIIKLKKIDDNGELRVKLDFRKTVMENANFYYEQGKHSKEKLHGTQKAIISTETAFAELLNKASKIRATSIIKQRPSLGKHFWFERFHWFITSNGYLVVGGRDAKSNDQVVKKYLKDNDRYCHADLSGAPSVVVKYDPELGFDTIPDDSLAEACRFALIFSKAWSSKIGSGTAYWVKPDQVSKTPQTGEFLARGAFVIRGKRNYVENINLELGLGEIIYQGKRKLMAGPINAVKVIAQKYVILVPGDVKKNSIAKQLSELFEVANEDVLSILPSGEFEIIEKVGFEEE